MKRITTFFLDYVMGPLLFFTFCVMCVLTATDGTIKREETLKAVFEEGMHAGVNGVPTTANPYVRDAYDKNQHWLRGYIQGHMLRNNKSETKQ